MPVASPCIGDATGIIVVESLTLSETKEETFKRFFPDFGFYYVPDSLESLRASFIGNNRRGVVPEHILDVLGLDPTRSRQRTCKTVLVEQGYVDRDYSAAYLEFYGRQHRIASRTCTRFHFFDEHVGVAHFLNPSEQKRRTLQSAYLGFSIVHDVAEDSHQTENVTG